MSYMYNPSTGELWNTRGDASINIANNPNYSYDPTTQLIMQANGTPLTNQLTLSSGSFTPMSTPMPQAAAAPAPEEPTGLFDKLLGNIGNTSLGQLGGTILSGVGYNQLLNQLSSFGKTAQKGAQQIGEQAAEASQFKPFTVYGPSGQRVTTGTTGGMRLALSPTEQALQTQGLTGAGQFFGSAMGAEDPRIAAQQQTLGTKFLQQARYQPVPTALPQLTNLAYQQGMGRINAAQQPSDVNALRTPFTSQAVSQLNALNQPSTQLSGLGAQAYDLGNMGLRTAPTYGATATNTGLQLARQAAESLGGQPTIPSQLGVLSSTALSQGIQGLQDVTAPLDIEALRSQYAGLAGQAAGGLLTDPTQREADIYNRIRAAQTPEEQRQRLALEERLAAQGRLGTSSAAYGGATPEQLALETAQAEARNRASLAAMEQARAEQQQQLATAQTLGGMTGQFAGISSDLQSAAQQRASQLAQLGLSAEQIQSQLESEGLGRGLQTLQAGLQAQEVGSALQTQAQNRATQLAQLGLSTDQIRSQLESEGLGRAVQSAGITSDLATAASGLESQALQRGLSLADLGMQGTQATEGLTTQQLNNLLALQQANIGASQAQQALRQGNLALGTGLLTSAYAPQAALLNVLQQGLQSAALADVGRRQAAELQAQAEMSGLDAALQAQLGRANLGGQGLAALAAALGGTQQAATGGLLSGITLKDIPLIGDLFG